MSIVEEMHLVETRVVSLARELGDDPRRFDDALRQARVAVAAPPLPAPQLDALVREAAARCGVDPALVRAVIANESGFDPSATSACGAAGLMQLMPQTARALGVDDPYRPDANVAGGTRYLRSLLDRFHGDVKLAVAAYNAGPGAVAEHGGVPPYAETERYVGAVLDDYARYRACAATRLQ
jgi:soluble lytic murein transglycosylase-like protein